MSAILELVKDHTMREVEAGEVVIEQGQHCGVMLVMIEGQVEILRDEVRVAKTSQPGVIFGEMSVLLGGPHTATVRAQARSKFAVIENPRAFLEKEPAASLHVAELLASRLDALNKYLIDVKKQYEGHDHLGMVDGGAGVAYSTTEAGGTGELI
jgi:CRP/FNR family transcriptional regulator, cyclic AMP receptor protein